MKPWKHLQSASDIDPEAVVDELAGQCLQGSGDENSLYCPNGHSTKTGKSWLLIH